jgi:hypothetical protein
VKVVELKTQGSVLIPMLSLNQRLFSPSGNPDFKEEVISIVRRDMWTVSPEIRGKQDPCMDMSA